MIYIDSAAAVKLIHPEPESKALTAWLGERAHQRVFSSTLLEVETQRTIRRVAPERISLVAPFLAEIDRIDMDVAIRGTAGTLADPVLRSLDAIHLATAMQFGVVVDHFVTYDKRLLAAASALGLPVASPGSSLN
ncbi:type II toxin-antitoxin system VapC family toxin [Microtetraspora glauca]|uniref:Ribonuclease VapC n=1 Tax=Microtetraspora glauca TaxID=1996 RepID=A0ABV3G8T4_MICGL